MKRSKFVSIILICVMLISAMLSVTGCTTITEAESQEIIYAFIDALEAEDYRAALALCYPEEDPTLAITAESIENLVVTTEMWHDIDFSHGVAVVEMQGYATNQFVLSLYSAYIIMDIQGVMIEGSITVIKDDTHIGIYAVQIGNTSI